MDFATSPRVLSQRSILKALREWIQLRGLHLEDNEINLQLFEGLPYEFVGTYDDDELDNASSNFFPTGCGADL